MALPLKESRAVAALADALYSFLPGSGSASWKGHINFQTIAVKVGVGDFWQGGSKLPAITALLERTLEFKRDRFEPLILEIVRAGILYRQKQGSPVRADEVEKINGLILDVGFKFPDLWDPDFIDSLRTGSDTRAKQHVERALQEEKLKSSAQSKRSAELAQLKTEFFALDAEPDRQAAGYALEKILNRLFTLFELSPREPFRVVGEQIDGSFELDHETYLLEARWKKEPRPEADLLVFHGKVVGKSQHTRGMFVSIHGVTAEAKDAITRGKQPVFFAVDGYDLTMILSEHVSLVDFLRQRRRLLSEEGLVCVLYPEIWKGSRKRNG